MRWHAVIARLGVPSDVILPPALLTPMVMGPDLRQSSCSQPQPASSGERYKRAERSSLRPSSSAESYPGCRRCFTCDGERGQAAKIGHLVVGRVSVFIFDANPVADLSSGINGIAGLGCRQYVEQGTVVMLGTSWGGVDADVGGDNVNSSLVVRAFVEQAKGSNRVSDQYTWWCGIVLEQRW